MNKTVKNMNKTVIWADYNDGPDMMGCPFLCIGQAEIAGRKNRCFPCHICGHYFKNGQKTEEVLIRAEFFGASFYRVNKNALIKPEFPNKEMGWFDRHRFVHENVIAPDNVKYKCSKVKDSVVKQIYDASKKNGE